MLGPLIVHRYRDIVRVALDRDVNGASRAPCVIAFAHQIGDHLEGRGPSPTRPEGRPSTSSLDRALWPDDPHVLDRALGDLAQVHRRRMDRHAPEEPQAREVRG
jgi:hypothetical protein